MNKRWLFFFFAFLLLPIIVWGQSIQLADSLFKTGQQFDERGQMEESEFYYREAYQIYRNFQDTTSWLEAGKEYASAMVYRSKNEQALELYQQLLKVDHPANDTYNRGDLYNSMGWASNRMGKPDQALSYYEQSLPLAEKSGDKELIGVVYDNLGSAYHRKGNYSKALEFSQRALPYFEEIDNQSSIAITLNNIGNIYEALLLYDQALEYYNRSLDLQEDIGNAHSLYSVYSSIAGVQFSLGNYDQALVSHQKSLELARQTGTPSSIASALNNIGLLYKRLGEYDKALDYYQQSLAMKDDMTSPQSIAVTTKNLGMLLWEQGKTEKAAEHYREAMELRKQVGNPYDIASSLNTMVTLELENKNFEQAWEYAYQIQQIGDSTDSYSILEDAATYAGHIHEAQGKDREALQHFKKAHAYSQFLPENKQLASLQNLARQYHKMNSDSALIYGQQVIDIIENNRSRAGSVSELKTGYFQKHSDFYIELASWVLQYKKDTSRAFELVEQAKARALRDDLAKARQNIDQQLPEEVRVERNEKRNTIDSLYTQLDITSDLQEQSQINQTIQTAELELAAYENELAEQYPVIQKVQSSEAINLEQAQSLIDENTAVLQYAISDKDLLIFLICQDDVQLKRVPIAEGQSIDSTLTQQVAGFRDAILSNAPKETLQKHSKKLFGTLIQPFQQQLKNYEQLIVVPDGALAYMPFEAILQNNRYLVEDYHIKYVPSLTTLTLLDQSRPEKQNDLLAVAGSQFNENTSEVSLNSTGRLTSLPSTNMEVDSIASHFQQKAILKDDLVTEQNLKNRLRENSYQYVHLATHGIIDESQPGRSGLALSSGDEITPSSIEDGMLRSSEIFGLNINSDMVVLSACNTGLGKVVKGEGMLGMQRSFFFAGASTVVVSLWNVYDRSTASLMNEFYKALLNEEMQESWMDTALRWIGWDESLPFGLKAPAMRQAKLQMINHPLFNHPVYWAPFIVVGR
ncbi:CHAT domain-containing protein [Aliifodinibius salicampi]|uniref:CHAT domain-containing protein n=1 Tax=Fodinibius salicampi TaxID=1920655 RepID=A0ABT3Q154_9BACT|nr:CHAT domain-containing protein [Fodinibius salicampi]MCW9713839.1 CHAT domain-containing protein [Fodinibius salicampi]